MVGECMKTRFSRMLALGLGVLATVLTGLWSLRGSAFTLPPASSLAASETQLATAVAPPDLVTEVLNGEPISVLYVTSDNTLLVRCYPGYEPVIRRRAMGSDPSAANVQQEGVLRCDNPDDYPRETNTLPELE